MNERKGYKAFGPGMICRGKQYEVGKVYEEESASMCESGMHYCENPMDVLAYYPLVDENGDICEFAEVTDLEPNDEKSDDSKRCTKKLKIDGKISFADLVNASVNIESIKETKTKCTSKDYAKIGSSGDFAQIGSSGDFAQIGSSGNYAQIGSSGNYAKIGSSGNFAKIGSSGDFAVIMCAGPGSIAKAKKGSWITLAEWVNNVPVAVVTKQVDGDEIKEDTFYILKGGEFTEWH